MKKYKEVLAKSLIDFEEIKYVLANNNSELIKNVNLKERYFLNHNISLKNANYATILENSYILTNENDHNYLTYKSRDEDQVLVSKMEVKDENSCIDFLNHIGYREIFTIEKNIYTYANHNQKINIINILNNDVYLGIDSDGCNKDKLIETLNSFDLPFNKVEDDLVIEKSMISKIRRYL